MQHVSLAACYRNPATSALFFSKRRGLRVQPSEKAKVDEGGSAKASQNRFQVGHARIVRRGLRDARAGTTIRAAMIVLGGQAGAGPPFCRNSWPFASVGRLLLKHPH